MVHHGFARPSCEEGHREGRRETVGRHQLGGRPGGTVGERGPVRAPRSLLRTIRPIPHDPDFAIDERITTADEFEAVLGEVLAAVAGNGIDPEGSWEYRTDDSGTHWEVMVIELEKRAERR